MKPMRKLLLPLVVVTAAMFAVAPILIARAPYESTMLMVQKIFYFHVPSWIAMYSALAVCGVASAVYLFKGSRQADRVAVAAAELAVLFGLFGLVSGSLWGRKAWGVWWQWDAKLTMAFILELVFLGYLMLRKFGGPGSEKLAAAVGLFGMFNVPFVYWSVNLWRTLHPKTSVVPSLPPAMGLPLWFSTAAFIGLCLLLLTMRIRLERRRAELDSLHLALEDSI